MATLPETPGLYITDFAVSPNDEVFLVSKTADSEMALYRVSVIGQQPKAELIGQYSGLHPTSVAVAPDSSLYICAYKSEPIKEARERTIRGWSETAGNPFYQRSETRINNLPLIHKFTPDGRKLATVMWAKFVYRDHRELFKQLGELQATRIIVDPQGNLYTYNRLTNTNLQKILPKKGLHVGAVPLPYVGFKAGLDPAALANVEFLDENEILYTVLLFNGRPSKRLMGYQVRTFDLVSGSSQTLAEGSKSSIYEGHYNPKLDSVFLIGTPGEGSRQEVTKLAWLP
jgi:hypothetical protein